MFKGHGLLGARALASYSRGHSPYRNTAKSQELTQEEKSKVPVVGLIEPLLFLGNLRGKIWQRAA
jgi:hypothetical protein